MNYEERFLSKATERYNNKFDYSKFNYVDAKTRGVIICPKHGDFSQTPDKHLNSKYACAQCWAEERLKLPKKKGKAHTDDRLFSSFIKSMLKKHSKENVESHKFKLESIDENRKSKYSCICPEGHKTTKTRDAFIQAKRICSTCSAEYVVKCKTKTYNNFIRDAINVHGEIYTYPQENRKSFKNRRSKIRIICNEHGLSTPMSAQKHLSGQGCKQCTIDKLCKEGIWSGGYLESNKLLDMNSKAFLYYLAVDGKFKIGITKEPKRRISSIRSASGDSWAREYIFCIQSNLLNCIRVEKKILKNYENFRVGTSECDWTSECFNIDVFGEIKNLDKYIKKMLTDAVK